MNRRTSGILIIMLSAITFSILPCCNSANQNQSNSGPGNNLPSEWGNNKNLRWSYDLALFAQGPEK